MNQPANKQFHEWTPTIYWDHRALKRITTLDDFVRESDTLDQACLAIAGIIRFMRKEDVP